jgi:hypothetical protein
MIVCTNGDLGFTFCFRGVQMQAQKENECKVGLFKKPIELFPSDHGKLSLHSNPNQLYPRFPV